MAFGVGLASYFLGLATYFYIIVTDFEVDRINRKEESFKTQNQSKGKLIILVIFLFSLTALMSYIISIIAWGKFTISMTKKVSNCTGKRDCKQFECIMNLTDSVPDIDHRLLIKKISYFRNLVQMILRNGTCTYLESLLKLIMEKFGPKTILMGKGLHLRLRYL